MVPGTGVATGDFCVDGWATGAGHPSPGARRAYLWSYLTTPVVEKPHSGIRPWHCSLPDKPGVPSEFLRVRAPVQMARAWRYLEGIEAHGDVGPGWAEVHQDADQPG